MIVGCLLPLSCRASFPFLTTCILHTSFHVRICPPYVFIIHCLVFFFCAASSDVPLSNTTLFHSTKLEQFTLSVSSSHRLVTTRHCMDAVSLSLGDRVNSRNNCSPRGSAGESVAFATLLYKRLAEHKIFCVLKYTGEEYNLPIGPDERLDCQ